MAIRTIQTFRGALPNIEKSAFSPGEYVGYGLGHCWSIVRIRSACGMWQASVPRDRTVPLLFGRTLSELSAKLAGPIVIAYRLDWVSSDAWGVLTMMHGSDHAAGQWLLPQALECQQSLEYGCGWQVTLRIIYAPS